MKGILVPDSNVVKSFLRRHRFERSAGNGGTFLSNKLQDVVVVSGAIGEKYYEVALNLVENYSPDFIISVGFASSLKDEVPIGTVILCEKLISLSGPMALWSNESAKSLDVPICRPFQSLFDNKLHTNGEYYVSMVYNELKKDGLGVYIYPIPYFLQWGTPDDLHEYLYWSSYFLNRRERKLS